MVRKELLHCAAALSENKKDNKLNDANALSFIFLFVRLFSCGNFTPKKLLFVVANTFLQRIKLQIRTFIKNNTIKTSLHTVMKRYLYFLFKIKGKQKMGTTKTSYN